MTTENQAPPLEAITPEPVPDSERRNPAEHLKGHQFTPGQSGNPAGKKKGTLNRKTLFSRYLEAEAMKFFEPLHEKITTANPDLKPLTIADQIVLQQMILALNGDPDAVQFVFDNALGKMTDKVDVRGEMSFSAMLKQLPRTDGLPQVTKREALCPPTTSAPIQHAPQVTPSPSPLNQPPQPLPQHLQTQMKPAAPIMPQIPTVLNTEPPKLKPSQS